jgi:hypothetical protein
MYIDKGVSIKIKNLIFTLFGICIGIHEGQFAITILNFYWEKSPEYWRKGALLEFNIIHGKVWSFDLFFIRYFRKRYYLR